METSLLEFPSQVRLDAFNYCTQAIVKTGEGDNLGTSTGLFQIPFICTGEKRQTGKTPDLIQDQHQGKEINLTCC